MKDNKMKDNIVVGVDSLDLFLMLFITLKLCHVIDWNWWIVLIPLWLEILGALIDAIDARCTNK